MMRALTHNGTYIMVLVGVGGEDDVHYFSSMTPLKFGSSPPLNNPFKKSRKYY